MNKFFKIIFLLIAVVSIVSCTKDDAPKTVPLRDFAEQNLIDAALIETYLDTHYITVDTDFNATLAAIPAGGTQISIRNQTDYPLQFKMVNKNNVDYKVYYLKLREGVNKSPTAIDSVHVAYRGTLAETDSQFDYAPNPLWFQMEDVIPAWGEIIPLFKTGNYDAGDGPNPVAYTDYGAGVMFVPSGLGYFGNSSPSGSIGAYANLIFTFKLIELQYKDHDRDGIFSKDEVATPGDNPLDYDSDGDGFANMYDIDDDGDNVLTKNEIQKDPVTGVITYFDCNGNGIPNHLDPTNAVIPCP